MSKDHLYNSAVGVHRNAYAPYSNFPVGVAILSESGTIHVGCNIENAAYPQGLCAEASAIANMISTGEKKIIEICLYSPKKSGLVPCGGCRQKISEFSDAETLIHLTDSDGIISTHKFFDLLPHSFSGADLV